MKAVIMAGGNGKRLRPLTSTMPKPMVRIFSKPVLGFIFDLLKRNMFDDVTVTIGYMAEKIENYIFNDYFGKLKITAIRESEPLGTAGSVKAAAKDFTEPFLVISGDCMCDFDLEKIMEFHNRNKSDVTIVCTRVEDPREYGVVESDGNDKVNHFTEKPQWCGAVSDCVNTGIYVISPEVLRYIPDSVQFDFSKDLFPVLMKNNKTLSRYVAEGYWCDIGNINAYKKCCEDIMDKKVNISLPQVAEGVFVKDALPKGKYSIIPPCYIGSGVEIGDESVIGPNSSIDDGCLIGNNCKVLNSFMMPFSVAHQDSTLNKTLICENAVVKRGVRIYENSVIGASATIGENSVIGRNVMIWPENTIEDSADITGNVKYSETAKSVYRDDGISGTMGAEFDSVNATIIGQALASSSVGQKVGIATDGKGFSKSVAYSIMGAMMAHGSHMRNFGESFLSQMMFYTSFCGLQSGVFISEKNSVISVNLCGEGGLPLPNSAQRDIENRIKYSEFNRISPSACKDVSDMSGVGQMYRRELLRQCDSELSEMSCCVKCHNEKIVLMLEDCLYRLGCRQGDDLTFKINNDGTLLSAFHRDCGWVSHDKISAIICCYETQNGTDVAVPFNAPKALDRIALHNGRKVLRYYSSSTDISDAQARALSSNQFFMRDALFMAIRLMYIIEATGKSLSRLVKDLPKFFVTRRKIDLSFSPSKLTEKCADQKFEVTKEGLLISYPNGTVLITPTRTGKSLSMISEAESYEFSKDLCAQVERLIKSDNQQGN